MKRQAKTVVNSREFPAMFMWMLSLARGDRSGLRLWLRLGLSVAPPYGIGVPH